MSTQTLEVTEIDPTTGEPRESHIVWPDGPNRVMKARVEGTPVEALCGHTWVPSRDPQNYPVCPRCKEAYRQLNNEGREDGWSES